MNEMRGDAKGLYDPRLFITTQTCLDIERSFNIPKTGQYHKSDWVSTRIALEVCREKWNDPQSFITYEIAAPPSSFPEIGGQVKSIREEFLVDSFIVLIFPMQLTILKEFGNNVIAVDSTHKVTRYDHNLTTIVVVDQRGEGYPVAFCISRRKDGDTYTRFFECVKMSLGYSMSCNYFVSDGDITLYSSWKKVMGPAGQSRLCLWHVRRAWGQRLDSLRMPAEIRKPIEDKLVGLVETLDESV